MSNVASVRESFLQLWSRLGPLWGISPSTARVHAWLLMQANGADANAISSALELSRGAVSMACKELVDWGLVSSARLSGTRRSVYTAEDDLERAIVSIVRTRKRREWDPLLGAVRDWRQSLEGESSAEALRMRDLFGDLEAVVSMVEGTASAFLRGFVIRRFGLKTLLEAARKRGEKR